MIRLQSVQPLQLTSAAQMKVGLLGEHREILSVAAAQLVRPAFGVEAFQAELAQSLQKQEPRR